MQRKYQRCRLYEMDNVKNYQDLIKEAFEYYAAIFSYPEDSKFEIALALDDKHGQYILREVGWNKKSWISETPLHVALRNNKIWIEEDWTEDGIATYFLEHGVPHKDIVLGFQPPYMRPHTEFAVS